MSLQLSIYINIEEKINSNSIQFYGGFKIQLSQFSDA